MANNKFNFYKVYLNDLNKLNPFQFKKVINALSKYADSGEVPDKLSPKGNIVFAKIIAVINTEKQMEQAIEQKKEAGKKGARNRWNGENKRNNGKKWQNDSRKSYRGE